MQRTYRALPQSSGALLRLGEIDVDGTTPIEGDAPNLSDLTLRHVDPSKLLFEHLDPVDPEWRPSRFGLVNDGVLALAG